ncbi:MAG: biotin carboxylase N-terminal domain-containing protein [Porticoccaceae bacterium]|nr:ATP-grasp domain-containing protein [Pseudomonadales bacterium]MCP5172116.1 ATP-grasp domain-containing protein [Pseudomonadales bacterium]
MSQLFKKVLVANRGEIALRVLHSLRSLGVASVAIYHHSDRHSPVVTGADEAVEIVGDTPSAAHLDIEQIIRICQKLGVDAVHPCYGFLSENTPFAKSLAEAGITFIGPSASVIELMGDKIASRNFVESLGFPVPPSVSLDIDDPEFMVALKGMEFPVVVKASAGGGGKGMSIVNSPEEFQDAARVAASEAAKYFGDGRIYVERYFASARHIEVQVLGDGAHVIHCGERECSIQRRFQKVIEEAPSAALSAEKRREICDVAVSITKAAKYSSAGTVEFLYTDSGEFFFLEMNTRIQVEHPVTEMVYGLDLVAQQILIAAGEPLTLTQESIIANGHSIECRICAEDAFNNFMPETGKVLLIEAPVGEGIRFDSGIYAGQRVTTAFDPMLAKLVVQAEDRESARLKMIQALGNLVILGVKTNIDYLIEVLQYPSFISGDFDTSFVHKHPLSAPGVSDQERDAILALALLTDRESRLIAEATPELYRSIGEWRN